MKKNSQHGGKRIGAGRKSKAEAAGLRQTLTECWTWEERKACVRSLAKKAAAGEIEAIKLLFAYAFGKPKVQVEITAKGTIKVEYVNDWRAKPSAIRNA